MRVAFIPSAYRTVFFHALGQLLEHRGHEIFWLSPNRRWAKWLTRHGVADERVLDITDWGPEWTDGSDLTTEELADLRAVEEAGVLRVRNIILMDTLLTRRGERRALKYLAVCTRRLRDFLSAQRIRLVLAEQTWAFELLTGQVCRQLGISHLVPHTVRFPDPRFGFFDGHLENTLIGFDGVSPANREEAVECLGQFRQRYSQPDYMGINRAVLRFDWSRIKVLTRHVLDLVSDPFDETSRRPVGLMIDHATRQLRGIRNSRHGRFSNPSLPPVRPFVFFPLHMQPEASIDIKGDPYSNQLESVRAMARTLPVTHDLYVKEHTIALTARSQRFYRELLQIPGVRLIDPRASSFKLITASSLVVTVTGTAAYEAALLGRPAATIAPIFFEKVVQFPRFDPFRDSIAHLLAEAQSTADSETTIEFVAWLIARSFPGTVGDALWLPNSMSRENLSQVADGFLAVFEKYQSEPWPIIPR